MSSRRCFAVCVFIELLLGSLAVSQALAQMEAAPTITTPPQQMPASGMPVVYPATPYPSAQYPAATPYPSTQYPATPYPSTSDPIASVAALPNNNNADLGADSNNSVPLYKPYGSPEAMTAAISATPDPQVDRLLNSDEPWHWQSMPDGLLYRSYLAGNREPRLGSQIVHDRNLGWLWDATVGGRVGLLRYGTDNSIWPQGWQFDIEGAAFPRLDLEHYEDLVAVDFRGGFLSTTRQGPFETKFGYYHLSSHLGDEYIIAHPNSLKTRLNYSRESLIAGLAVYANPSLRLYEEVGWAFQEDGGAKPWEFQFGIDYSSSEPTGTFGTPFFAINVHLRQENNFGGNMTVQTGWQWRGRSGHLLRTGMQYFNGMSDQYQFYNKFEEQIGFGLWYDY
jgi:hypothetical protein